MTDTSRHAVTRMRHEGARRRTLTVAGTEMLGAHMLRIRFASDDLADFDSPSPDDHVKLFLPGAGRDADGRPAMRDYTPRAWDKAAGTFVLDFALHEAGPATAWATAAQPGDTIQIGGPRGSQVLSDDFDWYLLIGDETAIPAIARRIEGLRAHVPVTALIAAEGPDDRFDLPEREGLDVRWSFRSDGAGDTVRLADQIGDTLPPGEGFVWIAAEASVARALRSHVIDVLGHPRAWVKAAGYWTRGQADAHERIED